MRGLDAKGAALLAAIPVITWLLTTGEPSILDGLRYRAQPTACYETREPPIRSRTSEHWPAEVQP